jgi:hypothetical protein
MVKLATVASVRMLVVLSVILTMPMGSGSTQEPAAQGISLEIADVLHERLNYECSLPGTVALYQGALANRLLGGIPPSSYSGRWDVYPREKVTDDNSNYAPQRATVRDRLFSLQAARKGEGEVIELIVHGERVAVAIRGVGQDWRFPRSPETTVRSLLENCSDRSWDERRAREREAAGLKPSKSQRN